MVRAVFGMVAVCVIARIRAGGSRAVCLIRRRRREARWLRLQCLAVTPPHAVPDRFLPLVPHPACVRDESVRELRACIVRSADASALSVEYRLRGDLARIALPRSREPARRDGLWRHTCFELFLCHAGEDCYAEFNFAPSGEWAAYAFDDYRSGMRDLELPSAPVIDLLRAQDGLTLRAQVVLPAPWNSRPLRLAATAVVEALDGTMSWWSAAHPPGKADFHHRDGFVLRLDGPSPGRKPGPGA